jgi:hypothetical protein
MGEGLAQTSSASVPGVPATDDSPVVGREAPDGGGPSPGGLGDVPERPSDDEGFRLHHFTRPIALVTSSVASWTEKARAES